MALVAILLILLAPPVICQIVVIFLALLASWELSQLFFETEKIFKKLLFIILIVLGVLLLTFSFSALNLAAFIYMTVIFGLILFMTSQHKPKQRLLQSVFFIFGVIYLSLSFGFLNLIFLTEKYQFWIFLTLAGTFAADTGAFFIGKKWGKIKLAPQLSPHKTVEGLLGGFAASLIGVFAVRFIFWPDFSLFFTLLLGIYIAILGVLGDLSESLLKRAFDKKDSGDLIPGHGGVLDRLDALLFTAPFVYLVSFYLNA